jgi:hypothetical protein
MSKPSDSTTQRNGGKHSPFGSEGAYEPSDVGTASTSVGLMSQYGFARRPIGSLSSVGSDVLGTMGYVKQTAENSSVPAPWPPEEAPKRNCGRSSPVGSEYNSSEFGTVSSYGSEVEFEHPVDKKDEDAEDSIIFTADESQEATVQVGASASSSSNPKKGRPTRLPKPARMIAKRLALSVFDASTDEQRDVAEADLRRQTENNEDMYNYMIMVVKSFQRPESLESCRRLFDETCKAKLEEAADKEESL